MSRETVWKTPLRRGFLCPLVFQPSTSKGETFIDTARNIEALGINAVVVRHVCPGAPHLLAREGVFRGPVKVVIAERDEVIPAKFGRRLFESYAGPKSLEVIEGANHNDVSEQPPDWWRKVFEFWAANRR